MHTLQIWHSTHMKVAEHHIASGITAASVQNDAELSVIHSVVAEVFDFASALCEFMCSRGEHIQWQSTQHTCVVCYQRGTHSFLHVV